jgi:hypothetical protein
MKQELDDSSAHPGREVGLERESLLQSFMQLIGTLWWPELERGGVLAVSGSAGDEE